MAVGTRPKATDFTGRQRERLQKEHAEELAARAEEMSLATVRKAEEESNTVIDYAPTVIGEVEDQGVSMEDQSEVIVLMEDLENMTLGAGNHFSFKAGRKYRVTKHMADHLREKGYVWGY